MSTITLQIHWAFVQEILQVMLQDRHLKIKKLKSFEDFDDPYVKSIRSSVVAKHTMYSELLLSRILDTSSYFFFEGPLEYAIDASLDWIAAAGSLLQAARVKKLGPFRLTSALLNSGVNSLLLLLLSLTFSQHILYNSLSLKIF